MSVERITVRPIEIGLLPEITPPAAGGGPKFESVLQRFMDDVNDLQQHAGQVERQALEGSIEDIHQVMIAAEEAGIAFELIVELRNKLVEAYQQLMRMQV